MANITNPAELRTPIFSISRWRIPSTDRGLKNISFPISAAVFSSQINFNTSCSRSVNSIFWLNDGLKLFFSTNFFNSALFTRSLK